MRGRVGVGRGESAGGETCPMRGRASVGRGGGDLTCLTRAVINRVGCGDTRHDDQTFAETCQVFVREGSLLAVRPVPCGGGRARGEGLVNGLCHGLTDGNGLSGVGRGESAGSETCPMRGRADVGREESAGGETCPCGGGRVWREGSLLAVRPVPCGGGERGERRVCWR